MLTSINSPSLLRRRVTVSVLLFCVLRAVIHRDRRGFGLMGALGAVSWQWRLVAAGLMVLLLHVQPASAHDGRHRYEAASVSQSIQGDSRHCHDPHCHLWLQGAPVAMLPELRMVPPSGSSPATTGSAILFRPAHLVFPLIFPPNRHRSRGGPPPYLVTARLRL